MSVKKMRCGVAAVETLRAALKAGRPAIIHVKIDPEATISLRKDAALKKRT